MGCDRYLKNWLTAQKNPGSSGELIVSSGATPPDRECPIECVELAG